MIRENTNSASGFVALRAWLASLDRQVLAAVPSFAQGFVFEFVSGLSKLTLVPEFRMTAPKVDVTIPKWVLHGFNTV
jgi:hypothetical protein